MRKGRFMRMKSMMIKVSTSYDLIVNVDLRSWDIDDEGGEEWDE